MSRILQFLFPTLAQPSCRPLTNAERLNSWQERREKATPRTGDAMPDNVFNLLAERRKRLACSNEQLASKLVLERLRGRVIGRALAQAQSRASRDVHNGESIDAAVAAACRWALDQDPSTDPPAPAAA